MGSDVKVCTLTALSTVRRMKLTGDQKLVLFVMAMYANADGAECYASQEQIASDASRSVRTIRRVMSRLEALGLIRQTGRTARRVCIYAIDFLRLCTGEVDAIDETKPDCVAGIENVKPDCVTGMATSIPDCVTGMESSDRSVWPVVPDCVTGNTGQSDRCINDNYPLPTHYLPVETRAREAQTSRDESPAEAAPAEWDGWRDEDPFAEVDLHATFVMQTVWDPLAQAFGVESVESGYYISELARLCRNHGDQVVARLWTPKNLDMMFDRHGTEYPFRYGFTGLFEDPARRGHYSRGGQATPRSHRATDAAHGMLARCCAAESARVAVNDANSGAKWG